MKKLWGFIVAAFTLVIGLFLYERSKRKDAEGELLVADSDKKDAVLAERQQGTRMATQKELDELEAEKKKKLSAKELEDYLKKNLK